MSKDFSVVGKRLSQVNALEKVTSKGKFTVDIKLPGMLYGKILRSPYAHAKVLKLNAEKAERLPGVKAVLTKKNTPRVRLGLAMDDLYLFDEKVRFVGEPVSAVVAESEDVAEDAMELIEVEYERLPAVFDPEEAMEKNAPQIHPVKHNVGKTVIIEDGNVERGFREADYIFEDRYTTQAVSHCVPEPTVSVCSFDLAGKLTVWASTQTPYPNCLTLAQALDMPVCKIKYIVVPHVGGRFGNQWGLLNDPICALLAKKTGKPVKLEFTRAEEFYAAVTRHSCIAELKTGVKKDGTLTARLGKYIINTGAYADRGPEVIFILGSRFCWLYRCPNIRFEGKMAYTNVPIASSMRGFGGPQAIFAMESQMDTIAEKLGIDPVELRLRNHVRAGDVNKKLAELSVTSCGLSECMQKGADRMGWKRRRELKGVDGSKKRGIGMAVGLHGCGTWPVMGEFGSSFLKVNEDGSVDLVMGGTDMGQGRFTVLAQIAAEELGISLEDVHVAPADTDIAPLDLGSYASRSTYIQGHAVKAAAADAKRQLFRIAARMLDASTEALEAKDRRIYVKGIPEKGVSISDVVRVARFGEEPQQIMGRASYHPSANALSFAADFAEVEVNTETGQVEVLKIVSAVDMGRAINPMAVEGQVEGSIAMGMGYALTEKIVLDETTGATLNPNLADYKVLTAFDMPKIEVIIVESVDPTGPFGAKGAGEVGVAPVAPAIANAISNATGVRIRELPITAEKILKALKRA